MTPSPRAAPPEPIAELPLPEWATLTWERQQVDGTTYREPAEDSEQAILELRWQHARPGILTIALVSLAFGLVVLGFAAAGTEDLPAIVFVFPVTGLLALCGWLFQRVQRSRVTMRSTGVVLSFGPLPWRHGVSLPLDELTGVRVEVEGSDDDDRQYRLLLLRGDEPLRVLGGIVGREEGDRVARAILAVADHFRDR